MKTYFHIFQTICKNIDSRLTVSPCISMDLTLLNPDLEVARVLVGRRVVIPLIPTLILQQPRHSNQPIFQYINQSINQPFNNYIRVFDRNSVALRDAERNPIVPAISARFVAHIPHPFAPNLRLKVSFLAL